MRRAAYEASPKPPPKLAMHLVVPTAETISRPGELRAVATCTQ